MGGKRGVLKKLKNINIMVIRIDANGLLKNARPCYRCTLMLKNVGINKVYYSIDNNIVCEKVCDMISINSSSMWKHTDRIYYNKPTDIVDYYKSIFSLMPNVIKMNNAECFVRYIKGEVDGCDYKLTKSKLEIYINDILISCIKII
jgi:hypothetical protein